MYYIITEIGEIVRRKQPLPPLSHSERFTTSAPATPEHCHRPPLCTQTRQHLVLGRGVLFIGPHCFPQQSCCDSELLCTPGRCEVVLGGGGTTGAAAIHVLYAAQRIGGVWEERGGWGGRVTALLGEGDPGRISTGLDDSRRWVCVTPQCVLEW